MKKNLLLTAIISLFVTCAFAQNNNANGNDQNGSVTLGTNQQDMNTDAVNQTVDQIPAPLETFQLLIEDAAGNIDPSTAINWYFENGHIANGGGISIAHYDENPYTVFIDHISNLKDDARIQKFDLDVAGHTLVIAASGMNSLDIEQLMLEKLPESTKSTSNQ